MDFNFLALLDALPTRFAPLDDLDLDVVLVELDDLAPEEEDDFELFLLELSDLLDLLLLSLLHF